ncbi:uncharacterized protein AMSG_09994 [Thecamonas trahens ATCC 50062]|uniref:Methyltransferase domain-containing protein n=1 Tax=Thecamonas trahens ATCC 50062 TaxID=461836 RepID=A0A0L0DPH2_THETB|nr:hypothetical protein AMSG_09994 [Thecamonas trahens ATCC 50062]KNC54204.1 hypothetical protein AMSG_09994 [Thecamonas trahens ATCC 50062]|eukprot:XP_013753844.1 hypothetical protein AMSG_09994 [Thecamonas trahens ATCC 50062]
MAQYAQAEYWEKRYGEDKEAFEWYGGYEAVARVFLAQVVPSTRVLDVGCGTSQVLVELAKAGYSHLVGIDAAESAISAAKALAGDLPQMSFQTADASALPFDDGFFGAVLDKGTLDTTLAGPNATARARAMVAEARRVLKDGGIYIVVSMAPETVRLPLFNEFKWRVSLKNVPKVGATSPLAKYTIRRYSSNAADPFSFADSIGSISDRAPSVTSLSEFADSSGSGRRISGASSSHHLRHVNVCSSSSSTSSPSSSSSASDSSAESDAS